MRPVCNRAHVCFTCNEEHSQLSCSQDRARSNGSKKLPEPPQPASKKLNIPSVSTPVDVSKLLSYLEQHPDHNFVTYRGQGLSQGFYTGINPIPTQTLECKNLLSARSQIEITTKLVESEMQKGFLVGPFNKMPFDIYRVNPVGIAEGKYSKKKRLIVDLSAPHNDQDHTCLNELINKEDFSLNYVTIDHAIDIIKKTGKGSWLCKTDISDAFKLIPIHPSLRPFHGIEWNDEYYFYVRLVFGSRSSPKIFDMLSQAICWIATQVFKIQNILHLLDDFLTIDPPDYMAERTMPLLTMLFKRLNIPIAINKTVGPTQCLEYLGIILDTNKMEARLPIEKVQRISEILVISD